MSSLTSAQVSQHFLAFLQPDTNELHVCLISIINAL